MRFDDSLETVLAADISSPFGAQSAWRQLVDLIGRRRVAATAEAIGRLRQIRPQVPPPVRAASARALAFANPPAVLVRLFAEDELSIAAPVLRIARLMPNEWVAMLPDMPSANRSILRHRRDLGPTVERALAAFGPSDFVLPSAGPQVAVPDPAPALVADLPAPDPAPPITTAEASQPLVVVEPVSIDWQEVMRARPADPTPPALVSAVQTPVPVVAPVESASPDVMPDVPAAEHAEPSEPVDAGEADQSIDASEITDTVQAAIVDEPDRAPVFSDDSSFVSFASVALGLPVVIKALERAEQVEQTRDITSIAATQAPEHVEPATEAALDDMPVAEAGLAEPEPASPSAPLTVVPSDEPLQSAAQRGPFQISDIVARIDAFQRHRDEHEDDMIDDRAGPMRVEGFRFETDAAGSVRWVSGTAREPLIGLSLDMAAVPSGARVDGIASGAFRRRAGFVDARLLVDGVSDAAGQWRITGIPVFDRATGRFTGYRGTGRRPRADERAEPGSTGRTAATDAVRQLVHELRTPTTAIAGFAEMIEGELLGPVSQPYRSYATNIRHQASGLLGAIDDLDTAARIDSQALDLRETTVEVQPMLSRIIADLRPLAGLRGTALTLFVVPGSTMRGDDRAIERVLGRMIATVVGSAAADETIMINAAAEGGETIAVSVDRPKAFAALPGEALLQADNEPNDDDIGPPLLGTGFALRLVRNLAVELGGSLTIGADRLTLRLPAAVSREVGQALNN